jgi:hypothetical protein
VRFEAYSSVKNDEYYTPAYAVAPLLPYLKTFKTIWCPFDMAESNFVDVLKENGHDVIYTHISTGDDFFKVTVDCDAIVSNPPYSLKTEVLERLFAMDTPFAMLLGLTGLFDSRRRFSMFSRNRFEVMMFDARVDYYKTQLGGKSASPYPSGYICHDILPRPIVFARLKKNYGQLDLFEIEEAKG